MQKIKRKEGMNLSVRLKRKILQVKMKKRETDRRDQKIKGEGAQAEN